MRVDEMIRDFVHESAVKGRQDFREALRAERAVNRKQTHTAEDVRKYLRAEVEKAPSISAWARAHGVSDEYVRRVMSGDIGPGPGILKALGMRRLVHYEFI